MIERVYTNEYHAQSDGKGVRPWFLIRGKGDGTAETCCNLLGHIRRFKSAQHARDWLRREGVRL